MAECMHWCCEDICKLISHLFVNWCTQYHVTGTTFLHILLSIYSCPKPRITAFPCYTNHKHFTRAIFILLSQLKKKGGAFKLHPPLPPPPPSNGWQVSLSADLAYLSVLISKGNTCLSWRLVLHIVFFFC